MKLKNLRDALERSKEMDGEMEVCFGDNPVIEGDELTWTNTTIVGVFTQHVNGPFILTSQEVTDEIKKQTINSDEFGTQIEVNRDAGFVEIKQIRLPEKGGR